MGNAIQHLEQQQEGIAHPCAHLCTSSTRTHPCRCTSISVCPPQGQAQPGLLRITWCSGLVQVPTLCKVTQTKPFLLSNLPSSKLLTQSIQTGTADLWRDYLFVFSHPPSDSSNAIVRFAYLVIFILIFIQAHKLLQKQMSILQNITLIFQ